MARFWNASSWAGWMPNGLGEVKPNHYLEILKAVWENRDQLAFAQRILRRGVCDGCALGTTGLRDFTMDGIHLCTVRLKLLRLNTMPALDVGLLEDVRELEAKSGRELRRLGRLPYPMWRRRGQPGFQRLSWEEAYRLAASRIRPIAPKRLAFYLTSRGLTNEVYYVAQKVARFLGTNNIDNSARICHAPSTTALKRALGVAASTCSYKDWIGTDLLVFIGSNVPNNQPVTTRYMYYARKAGTRIAVINPFREPGLERYWVPSVPESALFGTRLAERFFSIHTGGDVAFLNGVLKALIEMEAVDERFIGEHCRGFDELRAALREQPWTLLESCSGASREEMRDFARLYAQSRTAVFVWSMGVTQHHFGVDNVAAIVNLALSRGMVGRQKCGLMPIRGHSGVQGGAEVGCVPNLFPGGRPVNSDNARELSRLWAFEVPSSPGLSAVEMIEAAHAGEIECLFSVGGNFLETLPDPQFVREALERVPLRIHQDIVLSPQMWIEPAETVLLFPARTRYEQPGGGTETTTERYILFSPEIEGRRIGESRSEWRILMELAEHVRPQTGEAIHFQSGRQIRQEIARAVPAYEGIQNLEKKGDAVQWGGSRLCEGANFKTADGHAHFALLSPPPRSPSKDRFYLSTRRGSQFNSIVHSSYDALTGVRRDEVLINAADAVSLGLSEGDPVLLRSQAGEFRGRLKFMPILSRNVQVHWPEGNVLIQRGRRDERCGIPDYNALVELIPLPEGSGL
ncbi:MAG: FdhF/YdeP family oxidoreductase [Acidobacteriota bacterium]